MIALSLPRTCLRTILALSLGLALCLTPAAAAAPFTGESRPLSSADLRQAAGLIAGLGLSDSQRVTFWSRLDAGLLDQLKAGSLSGQELAYLTLPYYDTGLDSRYALYRKANPTLSHADVVTHVNIGLDSPFYSQPAPVQDPASITALVNKYHRLSSDYAPALETLGAGYGSGSLRPEAARQFRAMADAARADGIRLYSVSAYRSYRTQSNVYNRYLTQYSRQTVDEFSARPGHSEHQTGLALDINTARTSDHFEDTKPYAWLVEHCAEYGFILRSPPDKTHITGYRFEPWHYRYVGVDAAQACMEQGLTFEEYTARLPADSLETVPALTYQGQPLELGHHALMLDGCAFVSAAHLAEALGWTADSPWVGGGLVLYGGGSHLLLSPGIYARKGSSLVLLSRSALELDGCLYLSLTDLCSLLDLSAIPSDPGLELLPNKLL